MSDTQDDRDLLHEVMIVVEDGERDTEIAAMQIIELCRAHFQRHAEPVAESTKTNLIDESGGYWIDGEFRIEGKDLDAMLDRLYTSPPIPASQWLPIETAPKDGTLVLLLLAHDNDFDNGIEAEEEHQPRTIGHNNFEHDGTDRWQFAGWNWEQDCYTEGWGTPIAWMPLPAAPAPKEGA